MGLPTMVRACGGPCCLSALDIFAKTAGSTQSAGVPRLEPHPLDPASLRGLAGSAALGMP